MLQGIWTKELNLAKLPSGNEVRLNEEIDYLLGVEVDKWYIVVESTSEKVVYLSRQIDSKLEAERKFQSRTNIPGTITRY